MPILFFMNGFDPKGTIPFTPDAVQETDTGKTEAESPESAEETVPEQTEQIERV